MANWGAIGEYIGNSAGAGISAGLGGIANILAMRKQKELEDKYAGQQLANMLLEKEKQTEAYKQAQAQQQGLLDTKTGLQAKLDNLNNSYTMLQPLLNTQSMLSKNNTIPFGLTGGKEIANTMTNNMQEAEKQLLENKSAIGSLMNYLENPLQDYNRTLYDMAMNGNNYATQEIKDILYPEYNWQIKDREVFDPETQTYRTITDVVGTDKYGNTKNKNLYNYVSGQDYTLDKYKTELEKERIKQAGKGSGSGTDEKSILSAEDKNALDIVYKENLDKQPELVKITADMRKTGDSALIEEIMRYGGASPVPLPNRKDYYFQSSYDIDTKKAQQYNARVNAARQYLLNKYGYDPYISFANDGIEQIRNSGGDVYEDNQGNYIVVNADGVEQVVTLEDLINFGLGKVDYDKLDTYTTNKG